MGQLHNEEIDYNYCNNFSTYHTYVRRYKVITTVACVIIYLAIRTYLSTYIDSNYTYITVILMLMLNMSIKEYC